jgi:hypothetical protein
LREGSDRADYDRSCQGDAKDTDDPHDTVPRIGEPVQHPLIAAEKGSFQ